MIVSISNLLLPALWLIWFKLSGRVSDLEITQREERNPLFYILALHGWVGVWFSYQLEATSSFKALVVYGMSVFTIATVLTSIVKISLHATGITVAYLMINVVFNWSYWWLFPVILLVCWARFYLGKHSPFQLILGISVPILVFLTGLV